MNTNRRFQLAAAAVLVNAAAALVLLSPRLAHATTCSPQELCVSTSQCYGDIQSLAICTQHAPPGCSVVEHTCLGIVCGSGEQELFCTYQ